MDAFVAIFWGFCRFALSGTCALVMVYVFAYVAMLCTRDLRDRWRSGRW